MSYDKGIITDSLIQINDAIRQIIEWNSDITSGDDYTSSPDGMKTLAATLPHSGCQNHQWVSLCHC